jgi:hypothetical protein
MAAMSNRRTAEGLGDATAPVLLDGATLTPGVGALRSYRVPKRNREHYSLVTPVAALEDRPLHPDIEAARSLSADWRPTGPPKVRQAYRGR